MNHLPYGFVKCKVVSDPQLKPTKRKHETQYHLHVNLQVDGDQRLWDTAINVGTSDADDLLRFRLVYDFSHAITAQLRNAQGGFTELTSTSALPALDFLRTDILANTGKWRDSDVLDGSDAPEPVASLKRLLISAQSQKAAVYIFGRSYQDGPPGIHDVHMNQGSSGSSFENDGGDYRRPDGSIKDWNDIWQDGAVLVDFGQTQWAGYFTAFTQQTVPTDGRGNPTDGGHEINDTDPGSAV